MNAPRLCYSVQAWKYRQMMMMIFGGMYDEPQFVFLRKQIVFMAGMRSCTRSCMRACICVCVSCTTREALILGRACRLGASGLCRDSWLEDVIQRDLDLIGWVDNDCGSMFMIRFFRFPVDGDPAVGVVGQLLL